VDALALKHLLQPMQRQVVTELVRPGGQQAEDVPQVRPGLDAVEPLAGVKSLNTPSVPVPRTAMLFGDF
jgi:hypothetical protein